MPDTSTICCASLPILLDDGTRKYVWGLGLAYATVQPTEVNS